MRQNCAGHPETQAEFRRRADAEAKARRTARLNETRTPAAVKHAEQTRDRGRKLRQLRAAAAAADAAAADGAVATTPSTRRSPRRVNLILLVGPICGWLGAKDWNPSLVNIYAVTSILWFFFAVALFGWFLYLGITDKWRRYFVSSVTPGWFWFSCFWQVRTPC